jgi:hypothetical protein
VTFALWLIVVDPHFATRNNAIPKVVSFHMIPGQKAITDVQLLTPMLPHEWFWNPPCTNYIEVKSVVDYFTGKTMTNLQ